jgi:hypothetical protein
LETNLKLRLEALARLANQEKKIFGSVFAGQRRRITSIVDANSHDEWPTCWQVCHFDDVLAGE